MSPRPPDTGTDNVFYWLVAWIAASNLVLLAMGAWDSLILIGLCVVAVAVKVRSVKRRTQVRLRR